MRLIAALLAAVLTSTTGTAPAIAKKTLRVTLQLPLKSGPGQNIAKFKEEVERVSNGALEVQIFDSSQLFEEKDVPSAVASGKIEIGVVALSGYRGTIPAVEVFSIPFLFNTDAKLRGAVAPASAIRGPLDAAIDATGVRVLWWQAYGGNVLLTKGNQPLRTPDALEGRKVRVINPLLGQWVEANRGVAVEVTGGDQYVAYQRGTADVGVASLANIKTRKLWEVMDTITVANLAASEFLVVINTATFGGLSEAEQAILLTAARTAETSLRNEVALNEQEAIEVARQNKMTVYALDATELAAFRKSAEAVRNSFVISAGELGRQVLDAALSLK
jgi:C4-dicarboxylate-binding protein DctP